MEHIFSYVQFKIFSINITDICVIFHLVFLLYYLFFLLIFILLFKNIYEYAFYGIFKPPRKNCLDANGDVMLKCHSTD